MHFLLDVIFGLDSIEVKQFPQELTMVYQEPSGRLKGLDGMLMNEMLSCFC